MVSKEEKRRRAAMVEAIVSEDTKKAIEQMPISLSKLGELFDYLDEQLEFHGCNHTSKIKTEYLSSQNLNSEKILTWLKEQGGGCDCEILANVEENW